MVINMTSDTKKYGGAYLPKDKALKKNPELKPLAIAVNAATKAIAEAIIFGRLAAERPEHIDDYFKVKIWEHREGLPCPELDVFSADFFDNVGVWDAEKGEPAPRPAPENEKTEEPGAGQAEEELKTVRQLDTWSRAACLALFGPCEKITKAQYGQVVDLKNDDGSSYARELTEALFREPRALELTPERQAQLLAHEREEAKDTDQWPDHKKRIAKWLDTPADKRPQAGSTSIVHTQTGARLCTGVPTDRNFKHSKESLGNEIALGMLAREHEFNIYSVSPTLYQQAEQIRLSGTNEEYEAWYRLYICTPGGMDFSRAINIAVVKTAPEDIWKDPVKHREYFNRVMTESDHAHPDPLIVDIACGRSSMPMPMPAEATKQNKAPEAAKTQPKVEKLAKGVFSIENLMAGEAVNEQNIDVPEDHRQPMTPRQVEVAHAINDLLSGHTDIMGKEEAEGVVTCTGHLVPHIVPLLIDTIITTESCLSPAFSDEEIHDVATTILDAWSDNQAEREKIATDAIVEYRSEPELPEPAVIDPPVITVKPKKADKPAPRQVVNVMQPTILTYQQQLTIAALQGLCANPAHGNALDDLPAMAADLAAGIIRLQENKE